MSLEEVKQRIDVLRKTIDDYRYQYHVLDISDISEDALDTLKHELQELERQYPELITPNSPTQRVGGEPLEKFEKVEHLTPMLSMEDVFSLDEVNAWKERIEKYADHAIDDFYLMPKIDGLAITLWYKNGQLIKAITRGDGRIGENVTSNVRTIESVPLQLRNYESLSIGQEVIEIRGEIYITKDDFTQLNKIQEQNGEKTFANPRNLAAGSIRQLDPRIAASRKLRFIAWWISDIGQKTQVESMEILQKIGLPTVPGYKVSIQNAETAFKKIATQREKISYWIDGTVLRVNSHNTFSDLGVIGKAPRGLVAWKFPPEEATTIIRDVKWQIGRTGKLTPVATVDPTFIAGTTVTHASLHNADEIKRLDIKIGDTVILVKAGDIIPKIIKVLPQMRTGQEKTISPPDNCPICKSTVDKIGENIDLICTNNNCFSTELYKIAHAAKAFGIDGLGEKSIEKLMKAELINTAPDMFTLQVDEVAGLEGFAQLSAKKLIDEINSKKEITLDKFLVSLSIPQVGQETAISLSYSFTDLQDLMEADIEKLISIKDIGSIVAQEIYNFFRQDNNLKLIDDYKKAGITIKSREKSSNHLAGKKFVVTGSLKNFSREEAHEAIRNAGGEIASSVSKNTDFLIAGENAGSKAKKAQDLGITISNEADFMDQLKN